MPSGSGSIENEEQPFPNKPVHDREASVVFNKSSQIDKISKNTLSNANKNLRVNLLMEIGTSNQIGEPLSQRKSQRTSKNKKPPKISQDRLASLMKDPLARKEFIANNKAGPADDLENSPIDEPKPEKIKFSKEPKFDENFEALK